MSEIRVTTTKDSLYMSRLFETHGIIFYIRRLFVELSLVYCKWRVTTSGRLNNRLKFDSIFLRILKSPDLVVSVRPLCADDEWNMRIPKPIISHAESDRQ